ncbi:MAG: GDSL-type esterase/lipase family protein [Phycisphaerae bacterium]
MGISALLALFVGEITVRMFKPRVMFPRYVTNGDFGIRVNVPNARYWHTSPEVRVQFRINSMGIRSDREYTFKKPPGTIRIVGLGDSFTQGYEVDLKETYLYCLEEMLRARGYPVEVINLGVSGYGNAEELIMLREFGFRFDPDIVIVGYFINDPNDNVRSNLYRLDERDQLVRVADSYLPAIGIRNKLYSFWAYRWLAENSQLLSLARERLAAMVKRKMVEAKTTASEKPAGNDYPGRLAARLLDELERECVQRSVIFLLLDIPDPCNLKSDLPATYFEQVTSDEIVRTAPTLCAEEPGAYLYRRHGHRHWTPRGHEIAAELLAAAVVPALDCLLQESGSLESKP